MKQYLKQIKRHFPQLDSCSLFFFYAHPGVAPHNKRLTKNNLKNGDLFREVQKSTRALSPFCFGIFFFFLLCPLPKSPEFIDGWFRFLSGFSLPLTFSFSATVFRTKTNTPAPNMRGITSEPDKHFSSATSDCSSSPPMLRRFHSEAHSVKKKSLRGLQTPQQAALLVPSHLVSNLPRERGNGKLLVITEI